MNWLAFAIGLMMIGEIDAQIKHFQYFDISKGLISNDLTDVAEGHDGYIYLSSAGSGISRYDGVSFEHFANKQELGGLYFFEISVTSDAIWFGGDNHLLEYKDGLWKSYQIDGCGEISQIFVYDEDLLFCVGANFSFFYSTRNLGVEKVRIQDAKINQGTLHQGLLLLATSQGIWKKSGSAITLISSDGIETGNSMFLLSTDEKLMIYDQAAGLIEWSSDEMRLIVPKSEFPSDNITFMLEGGLGEIYFGTTDKGIIIYQPLEELWLSIDGAQLQNAQVSAMLFDHWDNAWISTEGGGLIRFSSQGFNTISTNQLSGRYIEHLHKEGDTIYIRYRNGAWDRITNRKVGSFLPEVGDLGPAYCRLKLDSTNAIFGTNEGLVLRHDTVTTRLTSDVMPGRVYDLLEEGNGNVIVASELGICRLQIEPRDSNFAPFFELKMLEELSNVRSIIRNSGGEIWYHSEKELGLLGGTRLTLSDTILTALVQFGEGLILGTRDHGLFFVDFENGMISLVPVAGEQLNTSEIRSLVSDQDRLWIGMKNMIIQVELARGKPLQILKVYDSRNGLPRLEVFANAMEIDNHRHVFVGTTSGILELLPEATLTTTRGPMLCILGITVDSISFASFGPEAREALQFINPESSTVTITVKAIDQRVPRDIRYFYKCTEIAPDWTLSKTAGSFGFYSMRPGTYDFEVKAQNSEGLYSNTISLAFVVQQPYYLSWWFILLLCSGVLILSYAFYRWRLNIKLRESNKRAFDLQTQNQILHLEQAASRLQMNPHFIFNALQSIQQKVAVGDRVQARLGLQTFSKLMRGYLEHSKKERISLEDELELLKQYLTVEKELKDHAFEYSISVPEGMDPSFVEIPAMMIQPFVENAIKHGLPRDHSLGKITIAFSWQGKLLRCQIEDLGPGISEMKSEKSHNSAGMRITLDRLQTYFRNERINPMTVGSYEDEEGKICGTRVVLLLPTTF